MTLESHVESPLKWPQDRPRTRFQDRKLQNAWKLSYVDTMKAANARLKNLSLIEKIGDRWNLKTS